MNKLETLATVAVGSALLGYALGYKDGHKDGMRDGYVMMSFEFLTAVKDFADQVRASRED